MTVATTTTTTTVSRVRHVVRVCVRRVLVALLNLVDALLNLVVVVVGGGGDASLLYSLDVDSVRAASGVPDARRDDGRRRLRDDDGDDGDERAPAPATLVDPLVDELMRAVLVRWRRAATTANGRRLLRRQYTSHWRVLCAMATLRARVPALRTTLVERPVFLVGFPRTGSTFFHNLLAQDERASTFALWQLWQPLPSRAALDAAATSSSSIPSWCVDERTREQRIAATVAELHEYFDLQPNLFSMHEMLPDRPDECCQTLERTFIDRHSPIFAAPFGDYARWLNDDASDRASSQHSSSSLALDDRHADAAYVCYRQQLQLMRFCAASANSRSNTTTHTVLKDATHANFLPQIMRTFKDARLVIMLRSPADVALSLCAGMAEVAAFYVRRDAVDLSLIGERVLASLRASSAAMVDCVRRCRADARWRERVVVTWLPHLVAAPVDTAQRVYDALGVALDDDARARMRAFAARYRDERRARGSDGASQRLGVSLRRFGLSIERVEREVVIPADVRRMAEL